MTTLQDNTQSLQAQIDALKAQNEALKQKLVKRQTISMKVSEKGALSLYGMGRWPVTLYKAQWLKVLGMADDIRAFIVDHDDELASKQD